MTAQITVAKYLLTRLKELGCDHVFGVPGDFALGLFDEIVSTLNYVGTCNELNAAYAADGYARLKGLGAVATTFGVGELSAINGVAGSFAERVPVVAITGSPTVGAQKKQPLLHHTLGDYTIPMRMYEMVTCTSTYLDDAGRAPAEIDRVLVACIQQQKPVYISIPTDMVKQMCNAPKTPIKSMIDPPPVDEGATKEALDEAVAMLNKAKKPIIVADAMAVRHHLRDPLLKLLDASGFPFATMIMGKTIVDEDHPQFIGLYQGDRSREYVRNRIEQADAILQIGPFLSDFNTGGFTAQFNTDVTIAVHHDSVKIKNHTYHNVPMRHFVEALAQRLTKRTDLEIRAAIDGCTHRRTSEFRPRPSEKLTVQRTFDRIAHFIPERSVVLAETGNSMFSAAETMMPKGTTFIGQLFYGSIGYTVGATLGAAIAAPDRPVILFIGDGSFQVTCQDVSTMIRYKTKPVVFLMNNDGYTIERAIHDGIYNDIQSWKYHMLPEVFGGKRGFDCYTEGDLENALQNLDRSQLGFIEIHHDRMDMSAALRQAGASMQAANS